MSPLLESHESRLATLPPALLGNPALVEARRRSMADAVQHGLPGPRMERWKYTSLRAMERRSFVAPQPVVVDPALIANIPAPRMVFVNGLFDAALSQCGGLPDGIRLGALSQRLAAGDSAGLGFLARRFDAVDDVFPRLNAALATEGVVLQVAAGTVSHAPLHLVFIGAAQDGDASWHLSSLIEVGDGAQMCVVEHHLAVDEHAGLGNALQRVVLGRGASLSHARLQDECATASLLGRTDATLADDASYRRIDLELGAAMSRHELNVRLEGERAHLVANGVLLADGRSHLDTRLGIEHIARDTRCELNWRGLGAARGRAVFHGGITIHAGADGSDAALSNKNLLLSTDAEIDTQPVLVIHADEVKAAHGATVGQLDPTALFYLRSRGLSADEARRLLTVAFCREPLSALEDSALSAMLAAHLDTRLHASGAL
jgi:Fe-S cluster assembly protein SufD